MWRRLAVRLGFGLTIFAAACAQAGPPVPATPTPSPATLTPPPATVLPATAPPAFPVQLTVPVSAQAHLATAWSPDSAWLVVANDAGLTLYDTATWAVAHTLTSPAPLPEEEGFAVRGRLLAFSPDGRWLATVTTQYMLQVWDVSTGELRQTLTGHTAQILSLRFNAAGTQLASAAQVAYAGSGPGRPGEVRLWSVADGAPLATAPTGFMTGLTLLDWQGDQLWLQRNLFDSCARGSAGWVALLSTSGLATGAPPTWETRFDTGATAVPWGADTFVIVTAPAGCVGPSRLAFLNARTGAATASRDLDDEICALATGRQTEALVLGGCGGALLFWPSAAATDPTRPPIVADAIQALAVGRADQLLAVSDEHQVTVWSLPAAQPLLTLDQEHTLTAGGQPFSPNGRWLVTASPEFTTLLTDGGELRVRAVPSQ